MSPMLNEGTCNLCDQPESHGPSSESADVRSNVRRFQDERFTVWRCGSCRSIHARDEVDLAHYYAHYPFHHQKFNWITRIVYGNFRVRLGRAGLQPQHRILDYGCGSGLLVEYLKSVGFANTVGFDAYSRDFNTPELLDQQYDCLIAQDLVEHVLDPRGLLRTFDRMVRPGGMLLIGTPNAEAMDLSRTEDFIHCLHQPYHTHIFSKTALVQAGTDVGWSLERMYLTQYTNTRLPCLNMNFGLHYAKCFDNNMDLAFHPPGVNLKLLLSPRTPFLALFGYFRAPETDITAIFRKPS